MASFGIDLGTLIPACCLEGGDPVFWKMRGAHARPRRSSLSLKMASVRGQAGKRQAVRTRNTVFSIKRFMGAEV